MWHVTETIETTVSDLGYWNRTIRVTDASGKLLSTLHIAPDAAGGSCMLSFADRAVQDAAEPRFASMAEARAYMETSEYLKLKAMIRSLEINS